MSIWSGFAHTPTQLRYVDVRGIRTRSLLAGDEDGENVIFVHGTTGHLEAFSRNIPAYAAAGYRCHAIDLVGHGYSDKPAKPYEIPDYLQHLLAYLDSQGIERAHMVGESLGGWTSAFLAADHQERVITLQLIAAGGTKAVREVMDRIRHSTTAAVLDPDIEPTRRRLEILLNDPARDLPDELVQIRYAIYHAPDFQQNIHNLLAMQEFERRSRNLLTAEVMARITSPTLVVWGRQNAFGGVPEAENLHASIPGSELQLFDDCGHWPQWETAELYNEVALAFVGRHSA